MRDHKGLETVGAAFVIGASLNIVYTLLVSYGEPQGLCGPEGVLVLNSPLLAIMPLNYILVLTGTLGLMSPYVKELLKKGFSTTDLKRIFLGMVVSGGSVHSSDHKYCIRFYGKDLALHRVFADLAYVIYEARHGTLSMRGSYVTQVYSKRAVKELREFSPEFETRHGGEPSISFILEGKGEVKVESARVLMSTGGWISCSFINTASGLKAYPKLGCGSLTSPKLLSDYFELMSDVGLSFKVYQDKRYEGKGYIATTDLMTLTNFKRLGGFLNGTQVKKGEFEGMERNTLLTALIQASSLKFPSREEAIKKIKELGYDDELKVYLNRLMLG